MQPPEAGREAEVCEFDMSAPVQEDVVWFYVSDETLAWARVRIALGTAYLWMNSSL